MIGQVLEAFESKMVNGSEIALDIARRAKMPSLRACDVTATSMHKPNFRLA
jgi:hypothetical protein